MNEIIKRKHAYKLGARKITIVCYADDAIFITENENNLQRKFCPFRLAVRSSKREYLQPIPKILKYAMSHYAVNWKLRVKLLKE
jgi:hypothetical protein